VNNQPPRSTIPFVGWKMSISSVNDGGECSLGASVAQADVFGSKVSGCPALVLYSSNEPGELS